MITTRIARIARATQARRAYSSPLHSKLISLILLISVSVGSLFSLGCSLVIDIGAPPEDGACTDEPCEPVTSDPCEDLAGAAWVMACDCEPSPEMCDGVDNDCDGEIDEELTSEVNGMMSGIGDPCEEGSLMGFTVCVMGEVRCLPDANANPQPEQCDAIDNDGDGRVDEDLGDLGEIACAEGSCRARSERRCVDGGLVDNCAVALDPEGADATCDGVDDDCDGALDEGALEEEVSCGERCDAVAPRRCVQGEEGAAWVDECEALIATLSETCDGLDNDCDEQIDEEIEWVNTEEACGVGECAAQLYRGCVDGVMSERCTDDPLIPLEDDPKNPDVAALTLDMCDALDNDCDERVDEDSLTATAPCENTLFSMQRVSCVEGERVSSACERFLEPRCLDEVPPETPSVCACVEVDIPDILSNDQNCDGVDGWLINSIFVHPTLGDDAADGDDQAPLQTLSEALRRAAEFRDRYPLETPREILVSVGEYTVEPQTVTGSLYIAGGYEATQVNGAIVWDHPTRDDRVNGDAGSTVISADRAAPVFTVKSPDADFMLTNLTIRASDGVHDVDEASRSSIGLALLTCDVAIINDVNVIGGEGVEGRPGGSGSPLPYDPNRLRGSSAVDAQGALGGVNPECCVSGECSGGRGGDQGVPGAPGTQPSSAPIRGFGGSPSVNFDPPTPPGIGEFGAQGRDATAPIYWGRIDPETGAWLRDLSGAAAEPGRPGGGGGGGAGLSGLWLDSLSLPPGEEGGGGGGGAGGCGGEPGESGESGGWSVNLVVGESCALFTFETALTRGVAGAGGRAGVGGSGEEGGGGGESSPSGEINQALLSHHGATGGQGGCGGHGRGGDGGASVGVIYLSESEPNSALHLHVVTGGDVGRGGESASNTSCLRSEGAPGGDGRLESQLCCPVTTEGVARCGVCVTP